MGLRVSRVRPDGSREFEQILLWDRVQITSGFMKQAAGGENRHPHAGLRQEEESHNLFLFDHGHIPSGTGPSRSPGMGE